jgi:predicted DNA-binding antitoxin AbrB/MazE fold protein
MTTVEAVYEDGIFKPVGTVALTNKQSVRLTIEVLDKSELPLDEWFEQTREFRERMRAKYGTFPDSTESIVEDRRR